jgi:aminopeptidase
MQNILSRYADLLVHYCVDLQPGEKLYVRSTTLAEPLIREIYRTALKAGGVVAVSLDFREQNRLMLTEAADAHLNYVSPLHREAMDSFDAYLYIRAPFNLREDQNIDVERSKKRSKATQPHTQKYFERTATRALKRNLCQYPTLANAQEAGMSLEEYEQFIFNACKLYDADPKESWINVRKSQQRIVDLLNSRSKVHYKGDGIDISFRTEGRTWINSDGQTNMPSGEVYTSPIEDSVNGTIHFSFPGVYMGHEVEGVTLWVEDGYIQKWEAKKGQQFLDHIFSLKGTRRFGEAAIGTNYNINRLTKNILFDEKMGGTVHMAIGQSYLQAGGKNESSVHWDMITDMQNGGQIFADDDLIYENGQFVF